MELPKEVKVGGYVYQFVKDGVDVHDNGNYAETRYRRLAIHIDPTNADLRVRQSLLHETLHAVLDAYVRVVLGDDAEEGVVRGMSLGLFQVLRDNPEVVAFILGKEE